MAEEDIAPKLREKSESQTLAEKSRVIKLAFSAHNRHVSTGSVKESLSSKPKAEELSNFTEVIEELEFQVVETKVSKKTVSSSMDNFVCFFDDGGLALITARDDETLSLSFSGRRGLAISK